MTAGGVGEADDGSPRRPCRPGRAAAPASFQLHTLVGMALFMIWPFTRLVHAFTAPFHYLFRPYIVYRSRDRIGSGGTRQIKRGWSSVGTKDREK